MSMERMKVGVAQIESVLGDIERNLGKHFDVIDEARAAGVELLLFPEMSLTGHSAGPETLRLALSRDHPFVDDLARAAGEMWVVFGIIEEAVAAQFHNTALVVHDGRLVFLHRKVNLATYGNLEEGKHFAAGRYLEVCALSPAWKAAVLICADAWNPALPYLAALHGSTLLLCPISSAREAVDAGFDNPGGWETHLRYFAMTYGMPVAMANRIGREGKLSFWGGSRIVNPFGETLVQAGEEKEELITAELDYALVRKARFLLPTVRDSNLALIQREINRLADILGVPEFVRRIP